MFYQATASWGRYRLGHLWVNLITYGDLIPLAYIISSWHNVQSNHSEISEGYTFTVSVTELCASDRRNALRMVAWKYYLLLVSITELKFSVP